MTLAHPLLSSFLLLFLSLAGAVKGPVGSMPTCRASRRNGCLKTTRQRPKTRIWTPCCSRTSRPPLLPSLTRTRHLHTPRGPPSLSPRRHSSLASRLPRFADNHAQKREKRKKEKKRECVRDRNAWVLILRSLPPWCLCCSMRRHHGPTLP